MIRFLAALLALAMLAGPATAKPSIPPEQAAPAASACDAYVSVSEQALLQMIGSMRAFMRDNKNVQKAMASIQAIKSFEETTQAAYANAKASITAGTDLDHALDAYREYQSTLYRTIGEADESEWDRLVAGQNALAPAVRAAARHVAGPAQSLHP